mgnify:CR=1 FL=1
MRRKGFTLVEGLVLASIVCILAALIIPAIVHINGIPSPYNEGKRADELKVPAEANPYIRDTFQGPSWLRGWMDAKEKDEKN